MASKRVKGLEVPTLDQPNQKQELNFQMSNADKDNARGGFGSTWQAHSSPASLQPSCQEWTETKSRSHAARGPGVTTRSRVARAQEELSRGHGTALDQPQDTATGRRAQGRRAAQCVCETQPERRRAPQAPGSAAGTAPETHAQNSVAQRPYRDRVIHLLALRNYKKPELLDRLLKDGISAKDRNALGLILLQVATINPKDNCYVLKDYYFKDIQKNWPGYTEADKKALEIILARKLNSSQNTSNTNNSQCPWTTRDAPSTQKQFCNPSDSSSQTNKKKRVAHLSNPLEWLLSDKCFVPAKKATGASLPACPAAAAAAAPPVPLTSTAQGTQDLSASSSLSGDEQQTYTFWTPLGNFMRDAAMGEPSTSTWSSPEAWRQEPKWLTAFGEYSSKTQDLSSSSEEEKDLRKEETSMLLKHSPLYPAEGLKETWSTSESSSSSSTSEELDIFLKYVPIVTYAQRRRYNQDFSDDYEEYIKLFTWLDSIAKTFTALDEKKKLYYPRSKKYQVIHERIKELLQKIKQSSPSYYEVKDRYDYLHSKLSLIKLRIRHFDLRKARSLF